MCNFSSTNSENHFIFILLFTVRVSKKENFSHQKPLSKLTLSFFLSTQRNHHRQLRNSPATTSTFTTSSTSWTTTSRISECARFFSRREVTHCSASHQEWFRRVKHLQDSSVARRTAKSIKSQSTSATSVERNTAGSRHWDDTNTSSVAIKLHCIVVHIVRISRSSGAILVFMWESITAICHSWRTCEDGR